MKNSIPPIRLSPKTRRNLERIADEVIFEIMLDWAAVILVLTYLRGEND